MQQKLSDLLKSKKCFKLVCGAGNEDALEVEKLVALYAKAGANYFDLSPREDVVLAAQRGIKRVIPTEDQDNYFLNVSVGLPGDHHARKAVISKEKCINCGLCIAACSIQKAIIEQNKKSFVVTKHCIGCGECAKVCPVGAISFIHSSKDFKEILPPLINMGLSSIELHASTDDDELAYEQWQVISELFDGMLSLCIDRSNLGDKRLLERIKRLIKNRTAYSTMIQADGAPMSGSEDDYNTTLQAVATADIVQKAKLPVWILLSGGTNSKTTELAKICGVDAHCVSIGSYARKIVKQYIEREDFLDNEEVFSKALLIAKALVDKSINNLK
ncbi:MAG: hypothetical protein US58_C0014G0037 [Candidatus Magasanikbacteria bacterium GW2011_GWA2_37_8]|uniref:4Fe-4S ferredoxin-type domain-containing protein n=1 Tax=Candidatus Magasanikbacteria bacterium GW2011_GWA2_37_8 TaxID=1619036 RepID=A0A0G0HPZ3_9BACT|nr:MAG: hypothetical protein US58_C0014G0037 [Candidatus Magasanikbacteria bacterium GW2011_GWA2_37_8]